MIPSADFQDNWRWVSLYDIFIMSAMGWAKISAFSLRTQPGMPSVPMDLLEFKGPVVRKVDKLASE
jgi:hypothetical protein